MNNMDLTLQVTKKESTNMSSLVKQMCSLKCRINVDLLSGRISIIDMDDENVESVIDAINEVFDITSVDIVPTVVVPEPELPVVTKDSIEFEKLEFNNAEVCEQANKMLRVIYWAMYSNNAKSSDICKYLITTSAEIAMNYNSKEPIEVSIGDVVDCNYGFHMNGEISGGHVHSIICNIDNDGMVYVLPITKTKLKGDETRFLPFSTNLDVEYINTRYIGGTVLLRMGRYVHRQRFGEVVGHVLPEFFGKVLAALSTTAKFVYNITTYRSKLAEKFGDVENDDDMLSFGATEENDSTDKPSDEKTSEFPVDVTIDTRVKDSFAETNEKVSAEDYLSCIFSNALDSLDKTKSIEDSVNEFLDAIGMSKTEEIIRNSFIVACSVKKINYASINIELHNLLPNVREETIQETLKKEFKKWLAIHPDLKESYPTISIMALLKIFAKKMAL